MKKFATSIVSVLLMAVFISLTAGNSRKVEIPEYSTTVKLNITADDEIIKNQLYSYINRELRSLGDVKVVENDPNWTIQIVALQVKNKLQVPTGIAASVVIIKRTYAIDGLSILFKHVYGINLQEQMKEKGVDLEKVLKTLTDNLSDIRGHWLHVGNTDDIQRICQRLVANFDAECLKKEREDHQDFMNLLRQSLSERGAINNKPKDD